MEQPETWIVCSKSEYYVAVVWYSHRVFTRWQVKLSVEQTLSVEIQSVLKIDLFDVLVWRAADTNHVESVTVQMEGMT